MKALSLFDKFLNSLNLNDETDYELAERMEQFKKSEKDLWEEERRLALEETKNIHKWGNK
tara:strand:- start:1537 stop:1716 length:180 start_codon:yes stop_codon:yes gene_type:complete